MNVILFADVPDFEGLYQVSTCGSVRALPRVVHQPQGKCFRKLTLLKLVVMHNGYLTVTLSKDKKQLPKCVHRIVAETFIDNPNNYDQVNHKNGNRKDNRVENLEWCTRSQNVLHAHEMKRLRKVS